MSNIKVLAQYIKDFSFGFFLETRNLWCRPDCRIADHSAFYNIEIFTAMDSGSISRLSISGQDDDRFCFPDFFNDRDQFNEPDKTK